MCGEQRVTHRSVARGLMIIRSASPGWGVLRFAQHDVREGSRHSIAFRPASPDLCSGLSAQNQNSNSSSCRPTGRKSKAVRKTCAREERHPRLLRSSIPGPRKYQSPQLARRPASRFRARWSQVACRSFCKQEVILGFADEGGEYRDPLVKRESNC
jgi:hypothetical protein